MRDIVGGASVGAALAMLLVTACPKPIPGPVTHPGIVQCATMAVQQCAPGALPAVNECLSGNGDVTQCLLGLIQPAGCVTFEVIACLTRHEGAAADHAFKANPDDALDFKRSKRAKEFLEKSGAKFAE